MNTAYFHCFAGISGDMILGSLVDAGLDFKDLEREIQKLKIPGYHLAMSKVTKQGIAGTKVDVAIEEKHAHRHLQDVLAIIEQSDLAPSVKEKCSKIFIRLAEAEAKIHNTTKERIHFHEVGSLDAIIDVVGAVSGLALLGIEKVYASTIHVGSGFTRCAHGTIPLPAPATLELLKDIPIYSTGIPKELVTPTGAAIISTISNGFGETPPMAVRRVGYGAGKRDLPIPNLLRLTLGDTDRSCLACDSGRFGGRGDVRQEPAVMIEVNIDDMNPEFYDHLFVLLFESGAQDVYLQAIQMKKNRPATKLSVLAHHRDLDKLMAVVFRETTTIGLRVYPVTKYMLPYEIKAIPTKFGNIKVKVARLQNTVTTIAPEYEDCRLQAQAHSLPVKTVYEQVKLEAEKQLAIED